MTYYDNTQIEIQHGKHKGRMLWEVIESDPNYALHAHSEYSWFPKLTSDQRAECTSRYKGLEVRDWSTYDIRDHGDEWS